MRIRFTALVGLVVVTALAATTGAVQARAVVDPVVQVTARTTVTGSGFGHGHGLSQYGAQGGAQAGRTAAEILTFYYPGTASAAYSTMIRVLITAESRHTTTVVAQPGLMVTDLGRHQTWTLPAGKTAWRLSVVSGSTRVSYRTTAWHAYAPGGHASFVGAGQFSSPSSSLTLRTPAGDRRYRGRMRLVDGNTINVLTLDNYVRGVIPGEMPTEWLPAALQAQAIAARTYAAYEIEHFAARSYEVCDT
jgi:stage II sporulation protein D